MSELEKLAKDVRGIFWCGFWIVVVIYCLNLSGCDILKDDTDGYHRSGVRLITDYGTGCQYLQRGGLTPRLDAEGKHICGVKE